MRFLLVLLLTIVAALALGIGSAWYMVSAPRAGTVEIGAWRAQPPTDADTIDPYTRARVARTGEIAMGTGEGLSFVATADDQGRRLDGRCDYLLVGDAPPARLWTLTATDAKGAIAVVPSKRTHLQSREVLRDGNGRFEIAVSAAARPGNWLPAPAGGEIRLTLRLYDTTVNLGSGALPPMPTVSRGTCR